jgi:hypothetical protein
MDNDVLGSENTASFRPKTRPNCTSQKMYIKDLCSTDIQDWNCVTCGQNMCRRNSVADITTRCWLDDQGI